MFLLSQIFAISDCALRRLVWCLPTWRSHPSAGNRETEDTNGPFGRRQSPALPFGKMRSTLRPEGTQCAHMEIRRGRAYSSCDFVVLRTLRFLSR